MLTKGSFLVILNDTLVILKGRKQKVHLHHHHHYTTHTTTTRRKENRKEKEKLLDNFEGRTWGYGGFSFLGETKFCFFQEKEPRFLEKDLQ